VFIASQLYLSRGIWGKAADGNSTALATLAFGLIIVCWAVWYRVRWARRQQQASAPPIDPASAD
jgi:hypothetical protein